MLSIIERAVDAAVRGQRYNRGDKRHFASAGWGAKYSHRCRIDWKKQKKY
jgi:hypothetical protein